LAVAANGALLDKVIGDALGWAGLESLPDLGDLRVTRRGNLRFAFNFGPIPAEVPAGASAEFYVGGRTLKPVDVAIWRE
ncbi:Beta-galactosidase C-terminal domain, partial [Sinorhizobium meliloti]